MPAAHATTINEIAREYGLDPRLVFAIVQVESSNRSNVARYEDHWRWFVDTSEHAKRLGITNATELQLQKFSYGLMQIMGGTARELGYNGFLPELCVPQVGVRWGCIYLKKLIDKYETQDEAVAAYNAGSPRRTESGEFENERYVRKVRAVFNEIKGVE